jgi:hypothetical protein
LLKRITLLFVVILLSTLVACSPQPGAATPPLTNTVVIVTPTLGSVVPPTDTVIPQTPTPRSMDALCPMLLTPTPEPERGLFVKPTEQKCQNQAHVRICSSAIKLRIGETFRVEGQAVQIGMPGYSLYVHENGTSGFGSSWEIREGGEIFSSSETSRVLKLISANTDQDTAFFTLQALAAGVVEVHITATGEIGCDGGPWAMAGGGSDSILITVTE